MWTFLRCTGKSPDWIPLLRPLDDVTGRGNALRQKALSPTSKVKTLSPFCKKSTSKLHEKLCGGTMTLVIRKP